MKNQLITRFSGARGGFTLIELVVAIVVFGILCAAASVSWASFMRYQELREDAGAFHKELLAAKAKALETGCPVTIEILSSSSEYTITWYPEDTECPDPPQSPPSGKRTETLNKNVTLELPNPDNETGLPSIGSSNNWKPEKKIKISNSNLEAFSSGRVKIKSNSNGVKKEFCIQKEDNGIKPELYYRSGGGTWKKM